MKFITLGALSFNMDHIIRIDVHTDFKVTLYTTREKDAPLVLQLGRVEMEKFLLWLVRHTDDITGFLPKDLPGIKKLLAGVEKEVQETKESDTGDNHNPSIEDTNEMQKEQ